ncbi:2,3-bisphosphoglycerate-independent phosphoglycerate mutase [Candidatus Wolfebacteria bacterium CG_4_10_14_0_8_um_filter_37_11]|uniref:2,3-bisphosphoglycerate-independent phosphoglycerate mutase n=2 Tax=Candidatus Wolfeibacteriota TaxID=1752735 RepID=A0A2M7Q7N5_9BACT|nr:MAG: 2,3-bisphosphoglycerate-independent phosphoglycerate mutase [Candidatus Wolfebacteria bacterium CG_4_10_14_0_8_um_filter_37_11]PJA41812.1 MAG: 2,3-bisphosphoglycerate-independent phosphoglycerate mutase [Candidatus Wolfebacteria bacterium CG_4_9_14_3_um_filter_37_9]
MKQTVALIILDGWGIGKTDQSNPLFVANLQNINYIKANFPSACLQASGIASGIPWGEEGNSEVGHLTIGAGKVVYQNYPMITMSMRDGNFFQNKIIKELFCHAKKNNSAINLIGLLSDGNVHASLEHLESLIKLAEKEKPIAVNLHLITDGRDSSPTASPELIKIINGIIVNYPAANCRIAGIAGRYYAMDRDKHWDRTQKYYQTITGENPTLTDSVENYIQENYSKNITDEYLLPTTIAPNAFIKNNDSVFFFNFREDRMRQIVEPFINKNFNNFPVKNFSDLYVATMVNYDDRFNVPIAFPKEIVANPLSKILSDNGKIQFKIAETEKYAHVTYFFNGENETPFNNEYRVLIPSRGDIRHDEHPEMMASEITQRIMAAIEEQSYDFILANYANADIIAHTGNYDAAIQAVKIIDEQIGKIMATAFEQNTIIIITSDHGNVEIMFDPKTGAIETKHDASPVPFYLVAKQFKLPQPKSPMEILKSERVSAGVLADIAPTILELMQIPKPKEMTGQSLLNYLIT